MATREDDLAADTLRFEARPRSITAAARRIDPGNRDDLAHVPKKSEKWQDEGWAYYDAIPEIKFAGRFNGNCLSRLRLYPAIVLDKDQGPVPLQDAVDAEGSGVTVQLADAADDEHSRLEESESGVSGMMHEWGVDLTISGDSYLVGRMATPTEDEAWAVYSESAITKTSKGIAIREKPGGKPEELPTGTFVARIWRRHSRWPALADSNLRSILSECEELLIASRQFRAVMKSRNSAGLLFLSSKLDLPKPADSSRPGQLTTLEAGLLASMITPTHDDSSASAVMPHVVRGDGEPDKLIKHFPLDRKIDDQAIARVAFLIQRLAHGLDTPVEILTGIADVNHWNAWQIEDQSYKTHLEPLARVPASGLAKTFLRPALILRGHDPLIVGRVVYGIDASDLTVRPNRSQDARDAFDRMAISWESYRNHLGFSDTEAPDEDEIAQRALLGLGARSGAGLPGLPAGDGESGGAAPMAYQIMAALGLVPRERIAIQPPEPIVIEASAKDTGSATVAPSAVGQRLADIELRLRDRLQSSASEQMRSVLRTAGSRLKNRAQGNPVLRRIVKGLDPSQIPAALGEDQTITAAGGDLSSIIDTGSFDDIGDEFDTWTRAAQNQVIRILQAAAPDEQSADAAVERFQRNQDSNRQAGRDAIVAALVVLAGRRLFTPDGRPDTGEFDARLSVPAGLVREALALAGGSSGPARVPPAVPGDLDLGIAGGVALGPDALEAAAAAGLAYESYQWTVGWPSRPFDPHQELDGLVFVDWDDPALAYSGWPADENGGFLMPGDHDGCMCVAMPIFTSDDQAG